MPTRSHQYSAGRFALEIEGTAVGFVSSVGGGEAFAQVIATTAPSGVVEKRPGDVQYAPIVLEVDTSLGAAFFERITNFLDGSQKPMSGVIRFLDYSLAEQTRLEWTGGLITEVAFPAAVADSKDPAELRVTIQPELTRRRAGTGAPGAPGGFSSHQKRWLSANFQFMIAGLENATSKVNRVESLVLRRPVTGAPGALVAGPLEVPDVVFTVAASDGTPFYDWFEDFIVKGNNSPGSERNGSLMFLGSSLKDQLIGVALQGLGILRVSEEREAEGSAAIARLNVELYCGGIELSPAPAQPASPGAGSGGTPGSGTQPASGLTASIAAALLDALKLVAETSGDGIAAPMTRAGAVRADVVAERLLSTVGPTLDAGAQPAPTDLRNERGRQLSTRWASTTATLDELAKLSDLDTAEWSALVLPEGHSLIGFLVGQGELQDGEIGPLDLARDEFTEGIVAGAADVRRLAAPHLEGRLPGNELPRR